jgi:hypothetical protein
MSNACTDENASCKYLEPHEHGFACDTDCEVCHGKNWPYTSGQSTISIGFNVSKKATEAAVKAEEKKRAEAFSREAIEETLKQPGVIEDIRRMTELATELSQSAIRDPQAMQQWIKVFPDICPACFGFHSRMIPFLKGMCTGCRLKLSKAQKQLSTQE